MKDSRLTPRKMQILKAIVDAHIEGGEPVGSKYLSQDVKISCSPATIRNEMAELEEMGYLVQPHTSAGRVPRSLDTDITLMPLYISMPTPEQRSMR